MKFLVSASALFLASTFMISTAYAADRNVDIINKTGHTIKHFYASPSKTNDWEEDMLGNDPIKDGETQPVDLTDGSGKCVFDFKAEFADGSSRVAEDINICKISTYTYR